MVTAPRQAMAATAACLRVMAGHPCTLSCRPLGYKYGTPPHRSWDGFTYARPLLPLDVPDLDRAPRHVSKFNGLLYLVRRSLLKTPGGHVNNDRRRDCNGHCDDDDFNGNDGGGGGRR